MRGEKKRKPLLELRRKGNKDSGMSQYQKESTWPNGKKANGPNLEKDLC